MVLAGRALIVLSSVPGLLLSLGIAGRLLWTAAFFSALLVMIFNAVIYILLHPGSSGLFPDKHGPSFCPAKSLHSERNL